MLREFFGNLIFAIIARMLCGNRLNCWFKSSVSLRDIVTRLLDNQTVHLSGLFYKESQLMKACTSFSNP